MTNEQINYIRAIEVKQLRKMVDELIKENKQLKEQLVIREKALELVLSKLYGAEYIALYKNNFIKQAKESMNEYKND